MPCFGRSLISRSLSGPALSPDRKKLLEGRIPAGRFGTAAEVAEVALFLVNSPYITGQTFTIDGGLSLLSSA